jgi:nitroreductase
MREHHELTVLEAIYERHATRIYTGTPVPESSVRELLRAAVHAPTAMHREPWAFVVIQDPALLARISARSKVAAATPHGESHRGLARSHDSRLPPPFDDPDFDIFYGASTLIVICAHPVGQFAEADCWLAAENLMLAATGLGLATCPIGFALLALANPEMRAEVGIPAGIVPVAPIIVGTAAGTPVEATRREPEILAWKKRA